MDWFPPSPLPPWLLYLSRTVSYADEFGVLVPLVVGLRRRRALSGPMRGMVAFYAFWTLQAPLNVWSRRVLHTNLYLHHLDVFVETWLLGRVYFRALAASRLRRWIPWLLGAFSLVALADATVLHGLQQPNTYSRVAQTVLLLGLLLWYFEHWLRRLPARPRQYDGLFLVTVGLTVYFAGSICGYLLFGLVQDEFMERVAGIVIGLMDLACITLATLGLHYDQRPVGRAVPDADVAAARVRV